MCKSSKRVDMRGSCLSVCLCVLCLYLSDVCVCVSLWVTSLGENSAPVSDMILNRFRLSVLGWIKRSLFFLLSDGNTMN